MKQLFFVIICLTVVISQESWNGGTLTKHCLVKLQQFIVLYSLNLREPEAMANNQSIVLWEVWLQWKSCDNVDLLVVSLHSDLLVTSPVLHIRSERCVRRNHKIHQRGLKQVRNPCVYSRPRDRVWPQCSHSPTATTMLPLTIGCSQLAWGAS